MSEDEIEKLALEWLNDNTSATCAVYGEDALSLFALLRRVRDDAVARSIRDAVDRGEAKP